VRIGESGIKVLITEQTFQRNYISKIIWKV